MIGRIIASITAFSVYGWLMSAYSPIATLVAGRVAGSQFDNSDIGFFTAIYTTNLLSGIGALLTTAVGLTLLGIWYRPARDAVKKIAAGSIMLLFVSSDGQAFFEKTERTEAYTIMPNESAFWIPDVGANKESQAQFDSEAYLNTNKLAVKRFIIPHVKLTNSGGYLAWDYYVPTGRLIILDRTPFSREWVDAHDRGTSHVKQGFPCQSREGLDITVGISIGATVEERDAAKFLYRFGVNSPTGPKGEPLDRTSGEVIFTSVYYGRSLRQVMDEVGRLKVQALVCSEIAGRSFDEANAQANDIMGAVENKVREYFTANGITLQFIGWADTFTFSDSIQKAVNDYYASQKLAQALPILQALAQLKVQEGLGVGLATKGPPIVVTPDMINALIGLVRSPEGR